MTKTRAGIKSRTVLNIFLFIAIGILACAAFLSFTSGNVPFGCVLTAVAILTLGSKR